MNNFTFQDLIPLGDLPAYHAANDPARPCLTFDGVTLRRDEFAERCNLQARQLANYGVEAGDTVSVILPNGFTFYEVTFAIWKLGATPNPLPVKAPSMERDGVLDLAKPKLVVVDDSTRTVTKFKTVRCDPLPRFKSLTAIPPTYTATYWKAIASGGSTGRPKLIIDHMPGLWNPNTGVMGIQPGDVVLNPGPLYHNAPFTFAHAALFCGGHLVEAGKFDAQRTLELIEKYRVRWVCLVPTMMNRIWRLPDEVHRRIDLSSLRQMIHMASTCPSWLKEEWVNWLGPERVFELYGGTERQGETVISGVEWLEHRGSVGKIQPGARLRVLDEAGCDTAAGEVGEIYFLPDGGVGSTYHYVGATAKRLGEWESLGDLGYLDADGYLYLVDRRVDLIVSGGANIYPAEVEGAVEVHPAVISCIVVGLPDDDLGQISHAIVQLAPHCKKLDDSEIVEFLKTRLSNFKIPRSFEYVHVPLRDDAGKARRSALREERIARNGYSSTKSAT